MIALCTARGPASRQRVIMWPQPDLPAAAAIVHAREACGRGSVGFLGPADFLAAAGCNGV